MICFVLGTSEGRELLSKVNEYTNEIVVSTATKYGGELLSEFKMKKLNTEPLDKEGFRNLIKDNDISIFVDASHPYAKDVSINVMEVCKEEGIKYLRYERKSYFELHNNKEFIKVQDYEGLKKALDTIEGNVLNTTGSNNIEKIESLGLKNRIIHRILPTPKILEKILKLGVSYENIIGMKGPFGKEINNGIIKEFNIKALITKDSGLEGGALEKVEAALENQVKVVILEKPKLDYGVVFDSLDELNIELRRLKGEK